MAKEETVEKKHFNTLFDNITHEDVEFSPEFTEHPENDSTIRIICGEKDSRL